MKKFFCAIGRFFKRTGFLIVKFLVLTVREMKMLRWPSKQTMKEASAIVLAFVLVVF